MTVTQASDFIDEIKEKMGNYTLDEIIEMNGGYEQFMGEDSNSNNILFTFSINLRKELNDNDNDINITI